jgi:Mrp family chromosome partitioning ATPase
MNVRVPGVVENMSYLVLADTGKRLEIFGRSKGEEMARRVAMYCQLSLVNRALKWQNLMRRRSARLAQGLEQFLSDDKAALHNFLSFRDDGIDYLLY